MLAVDDNHNAKEAILRDLHILQAVKTTSYKKLVFESSRYLNAKGENLSGNIRNIKDVAGQKTLKKTPPMDNSVYWRPCWPVEESKLPGTNLSPRKSSIMKNFGDVVQCSRMVKVLNKRPSFLQNRTSVLATDRLFMKIGKTKEESCDSDEDDVGSLDQSRNKSFKRKRSFLNGRRQSRRMSKFANSLLFGGKSPMKESETVEDGEKTIKRDVRRKFRAAGFMAIFSARLAIAYTRNTTDGDISPFVQQVNFKQEERKVNSENGFLAFDASKFKANREMRISEETKRILSKVPWERTERELYHVEVLLRGIKDFADYPVGMQRKIAEVGQYRCYDAKRVIVREGHVATNFYFILSGSVVVMVMDDSRKYAKPVAFLHRGHSFGELALVNNSRRQSTVVAQEKVEMLAIWFEDYLDIFMAGGVKNIHDPDHNDFIKSLPILKYWPIELLEDQPKKFVFHFYKRGEIVVKDTHYSNWIVIVKSGSLSILKKLKRVEAFECRKTKLDVAKVQKSEKQKQKEKDTRKIMRKIILPDLKIPLKTPDDTELLDDDAEIDESARSQDDKTSEADSIETTDSQRTLIEKQENYNILDPDFKQEIRTMADDFDNAYRNKDPSEYTEADINPQFVNVQTLTKGMYYGVTEFVLDKQSSFSIISNGAECILLDKQFYLDHASDRCMTEARHEVQPYPCDDEMQSGLQTCVDWEAYREVALMDALKEIQIKKELGKATLPFH